MLRLKVPGIIATHDLSIIELKHEHPYNIEKKSFEIDILGEKITYNYKLKEGSSDKMNALILMKQMGLIEN